MITRGHIIVHNMTIGSKVGSTSETQTEHSISTNISFTLAQQKVQIITRREQATILEGSLKCTPNSQQLPLFIFQSGQPLLLSSVLLLSSDTYLSIKTRLPLFQRLKACEGCDVKSGHQASYSGFEQYKNYASGNHWITFSRQIEKNNNCASDNVPCFIVNVM